MRPLLFWAALMGVFLFVGTTIVAGAMQEGYNHIGQFISESYARGTVHGPVLRFMGFLPAGLLLALFGFGAPAFFPKSGLVKIAFLGVAVFYGLGTMVTSIFPCDPGCSPELENASVSQLIHNLSGSLTYFLVPLCIIGIGYKAKGWKEAKRFSVMSLLCGFMAAGFVILLFSDPLGPLKGWYQRLIEGSILIWILCAAFVVRKIDVGQ